MADAAAPVDDGVSSGREAVDEPAEPHPFSPTQVGYWLCRDTRLPMMRQRLAGFARLDALILSGQEYARFWPYVSNVWNKNSWRDKLSSDGLHASRIEYFECKFRREWKRKGCGVRSTVSTTVPPCQAYLKMTVEFAPPNGEATDRIERVILEYSYSHTTHDLQACDEHRINDGILTACEETLLSHDLKKDRAHKAWKTDKASRALAELCGLRKPVGPKQWDNWERRARKLTKRTRGTGQAS